MPQIGFKGFQIGSTVSLAAAQGAISASDTVALWGEMGGPQSPNASMTIQLVDGHSDVVAPYSAMFRATNLEGFAVSEPVAPMSGVGANVYDPTSTRVHYIWDFGDGSYVRRFTPNLFDQWKNLNLGRGKQVGHFWMNPGTYKVKCWAFDDFGNWAYAEFDLVIADPNVFWAGNRTICVSYTNDFTGAPAGATLVTTVEAAWQAMRNLWSASPVFRSPRVLIRSAETWTDLPFFDASSFLGPHYTRDNLKGLHIGRFGPGGLPTMRRTTLRSSLYSFPDRADCRQMCVTEIDFHGPWDCTTETGDSRFASGSMQTANGTAYTLARCRFSGFDSGPTDHRSSRLMTLFDNEVTNWANYGGFLNQIAGGPQRVVLVGNRFAQDPDALNGISQGGPIQGVSVDQSQEPTELGNRHGAGRMAPDQAYISGNEFFGANGWFFNNAGNLLAQSALQGYRYHHGGPANAVRQQHHLERNSFEGGDGVFSVCWSSAGPNQTSAKNFVLESNLLVGVSGTYDPLLSGNICGAAVRHNYLWRPGVTKTHPNSIKAEISWGANLGSTDASEVLIHNNTLISEALASHGFEPAYAPIKTSGPQAYTVADNVVRTLNRAASDDPTVEPLGTTLLTGFQTQWQGGRWNFFPITGFAGARREGGAGNVAVGEWIEVDYPLYSNHMGRGPLQITQAMCLTSAAQNHKISVAPNETGARGHPWKQMTAGDGVTFEFTPTKIRVRNEGARPAWSRAPNPARQFWSTGDYFYILLDLRDFLLPAIAGTGVPGTQLKLAVPLAGSSAIKPTPLTVPSPVDALLTTRKGARRQTAPFDIKTDGQHYAGAFVPLP
jgi:hypothetical protein